MRVLAAIGILIDDGSGALLITLFMLGRSIAGQPGTRPPIMAHSHALNLAGVPTGGCRALEPRVSGSLSQALLLQIVSLLRKALGTT